MNSKNIEKGASADESRIDKRYCCGLIKAGVFSSGITAKKRKPVASPAHAEPLMLLEATDDEEET